MRRTVIVLVWLAALFAAGTALRSALGGTPGPGPAEAGPGARRLVDLEKRRLDLGRREAEERARAERLKAAPEPSPSSVGMLLRESDDIVDKIDAMKDLGEDVRNVLMLVHHRGIEQFGVRDWILRERVPDIRERIQALGVPEAEADAAARSLVDLLVAHQGRQLDSYVGVAESAAKEAELLAEHHRQETRFLDGQVNELRQKLEAVLGPERGLEVMKALISEPGFRRPTPLMEFFPLLQEIKDTEVRSTYGRRLHEELTRLAEEGRLSQSAYHMNLYLDEEAARSIRALMTSALPYVDPDRTSLYENDLDHSLKNGIASAIGLKQVVTGLRRLQPKKK